MPTVRYRVYINEDTVHGRDLDTQTPIRLLIEQLMDIFDLPATDKRGGLLEYALYGGPDHQRLSSEQTLAQTAFAKGGDLYLANTQRPWWLPPAPPPRRRTDQRAYLIPLAIVALVVVLLSGWRLISVLASGSTSSAPTAQPALTVAPTDETTAQPTAGTGTGSTSQPSQLAEGDPPTRTPLPTPSPTLTPTPTNTPSPTLTPTPSDTPTPLPTRTPSPTRTPVPPVRFTVAVDVPTDGDGNSGLLNSCVSGRVRRRDGSAYGGVIIQINNGDKIYHNSTGADGEFHNCGLGASRWNVVLVQLPDNRPLPLPRPNGQVYLNGSGAKETIVNFYER